MQTCKHVHMQFGVKVSAEKLQQTGSATDFRWFLWDVVLLALVNVNGYFIIWMTITCEYIGCLRKLINESMMVIVCDAIVPYDTGISSNEAVTGKTTARCCSSKLAKALRSTTFWLLVSLPPFIHAYKCLLNYYQALHIPSVTGKSRTCRRCVLMSFDQILVRQKTLTDNSLMDVLILEFNMSFLQLRGGLFNNFPSMN